MPYYHVECEGKIGLWTRKCNKCGKVWPLKVLFAMKYPRDMVMMKNQRKLPRWMMNRGGTPYAKWADNAPPGVGSVASHLPNWPRWARVLSLVVLVLLVASIVYFWRGK